MENGRSSSSLSSEYDESETPIINENKSNVKFLLKDISDS